MIFDFERTKKIFNLLSPTDSEMELLNKAQIYIFEKDHKRADEILSIAGDYSKEYAFLVGCYHNDERNDTFEAINWFRSASDLDCAKYELAHLFWSLRNYTEADYWFKKCIENDYQDAEEHHENMLVDQHRDFMEDEVEIEDEEDAEEDAESEEVESDEDEEYNQYHTCLDTDNAYDAMYATLNDHIEASSKKLCPNLYLGKMYGLFGNYAESKFYYNKAAEIFGNKYSKNVVDIFSLPQVEKSENMCCVCHENEKICKLSCKHHVCYTCLCKLNVSNSRKCPMCRDNFFK